jgi:uncharacterized protein (UPF0128 family)
MLENLEKQIDLLTIRFQILIEQSQSNIESELKKEKNQLEILQESDANVLLAICRVAEQKSQLLLVEYANDVLKLYKNPYKILRGAHGFYKHID